jgi:hypothetical protein
VPTKIKRQRPLQRVSAEVELDTDLNDILDGVHLDRIKHKVGREEERDKIKNQRLKSRARMKDLRLKVAAKESLMRKAINSDTDYEVILEVYYRGLDKHKDEQKAFDRVNSFINKGKASQLDCDLIGEVE